MSGGVLALPARHVGAAIEAAGYDRDFALLADDGRSAGPPVPGRGRSLRLSGRLLSHSLNFAVWLLAFGHGIFAGTDATTPLGVALYLTSAGVVGWLVAARFVPAERPVGQLF